MHRAFLALVLLLSSCDKPPAPAPVVEQKVSKPAGKPLVTKEQAAAQIMAGGMLPDGSFLHGDHIHKPGQKNCPADAGGGPVM